MRKLIMMLLCIAEMHTFAQDTVNNKTVDELFDLSLDDFLNVVVTPSKQPQSGANVTQKIDVIDNNELETSVSGNRNLCEYIMCLPGASVSVLSRNDANWGTYGGIGPKYSTYMLQGVPIDAFIDPMSLDINIIDHIEVQRGPASIIYPNYNSQDFAGSQSPLSGTVNLILKEKIDKKETSIRSAIGSYNTLEGKIFHQNKINQLNYFAGCSSEKSDYTNYGSSGSWLNMQKDPEYNKTKLFGGLTLFLDNNQKLTLFYNRTWHTGDAGRIYKSYRYLYSTINIGYNIDLSSRLSLQSHIGVRTYNRDWNESSFGVIDTNKSENGVIQHIIPMDLMLSWYQGKSASFVVGADYQDADYQTWTDPLIGYHIVGNKSTAAQSGFYIQQEWHSTEKITLRGGLRYATISNVIDLNNQNIPPHRKLSWSKLLWSAGARYSPGRLSVFANAGSSFSAPGLKSIGGTLSASDIDVPGKNGQLPNNDLVPENGLSIDVGIESSPLPKMIVTLRAFYTILNDGIVDNIVSLNPSQTQSINTESSSKGGEIEFTHKINSSFKWYVNATYMKTNIKNKLNAELNNVEIPFSPDYVANAGALLSLPIGLIFKPSLNYNNGFYDALSKNTRQHFKPGILINAYLAQKLLQNNVCSMDCYAQLYNITNNKYKMPWQFINTGFSGMIGLKVYFK